MIISNICHGPQSGFSAKNGDKYFYNLQSEALYCNKLFTRGFTSRFDQLRLVPGVAIRIGYTWVTKSPYGHRPEASITPWRRGNSIPRHLKLRKASVIRRH